jgi:hypothetical protein
MRELRSLLAFTLLCCAMASVGCLDYGGEDDPFVESQALAVSAESAVALSQARDDWERWAPRCDGFPSKQDCDDGDMTLFNGLLCASGDPRGCDAVHRAQGSDGRFWRSPSRVGHNRGQGNSFSRDMSLGVLLYLATTRDRGAAERWMRWIDRNRPCVAKKPGWAGGGCWLRGLHRMCRDDTDNRCTLTPSVWALMYRVWRHIGLSPSTYMRNAHNDLVNAFPQIQARTNEPGYQLHLDGVSALLNQIVGYGGNGNVRAVAAQLLRRQPDNPFFHYLVHGPSDHGVRQTLRLCPSTGTHRKVQWAWERATADAAWRESMGWDCIFMVNMLEQ